MKNGFRHLLTLAIGFFLFFVYFTPTFSRAAQAQIHSGVMSFCGTGQCFRIQFEKAAIQQQTWYLRKLQIYIVKKSSTSSQAPLHQANLKPTWQAKSAIWEEESGRIYLDNVTPELRFEQLFYLDLETGESRLLKDLL